MSVRAELRASRGRHPAVERGPTHAPPPDTPKRWPERRWAARSIRVLVFVVPLVTSFAAAWVLSSRVATSDQGWIQVMRWLAIAAVATFVMLVTQKAMRRLLPLAALFSLTLVFPDETPSRFGLALRGMSARRLRQQLADVDHVDLGDTPTEAAESLLELVAGLSRHDRLTRGHSERVRAYAVMLGEEMELDATELDHLRWAALLHDVGKLHVPAEILNKPGALSRDEFETVKRHTTAGRAMVAPLAAWLGPSANAVYEHHERWSGGGYPTGVSASGLALTSRIVSVADAFDVMTSARSYKAPMSLTAARAELQRCAGSQFDPEVVRAMMNISLGRLWRAVGPMAWAAQLGLFPRAALQSGAAGSVAAAATTSFVLSGVAIVAEREDPVPLGFGAAAVASAAVADVATDGGDERDALGSVLPATTRDAGSGGADGDRSAVSASPMSPVAADTTTTAPTTTTTTSTPTTPTTTTRIVLAPVTSTTGPGAPSTITVTLPPTTVPRRAVTTTTVAAPSSTVSTNPPPTTSAVAPTSPDAPPSPTTTNVAAATPPPTTSPRGTPSSTTSAPTAPASTTTTTAATTTSKPVVSSVLVLASPGPGDQMSQPLLDLVPDRPPLNDVLPNYDVDRDARPGLTVVGRPATLKSTVPDGVQVWRFPTSFDTVDGTVRLDLWVAPIGPPKPGLFRVRAGLFDCDLARTSCTRIARDTLTLAGEDSVFVRRKFDLTIGSDPYRAAPGRRLELRYSTLTGSSNHSMIAYDAVGFPSRLTITSAHRSGAATAPGSPLGLVPPLPSVALALLAVASVLAGRVPRRASRRRPEATGGLAVPTGG